MEWNRREDRQREHFCRRLVTIPPRQTSHPRGGRDEAGGSAFEEWNATLGVYECRGDVGEWIENPDLLRRDEICRSTSVLLTPGSWKFMRIPRKVSDRTACWAKLLLRRCKNYYDSWERFMQREIE